jgi:hypothetical protein
MPTGPGQQLAFSFLEGDHCGLRTLVLTRPLRRHRLRAGVVRKIRYVETFFPELKGRTLRIGLTRSANGLAVAGGTEIWFNPAGLSHHTIAHEFTHLLQGRPGLPTGERSCDVFCLARHWTLNDAVPNYVRIPKTLVDEKERLAEAGAKLIFTVASEAVHNRSKGLRNYIAWFESELAVRAQAAPPARISRPG